jgi:hypothetical protein
MLTAQWRIVVREEIMKKLFSIFGALCLVAVASTSPWASELKVTNLSKIEIYPIIISGKSKESFGVVAIGKSATVGFSPFRLGDKVEISWEEGESYELTSVTIDSSSLRVIQRDVESIHLIYNGQRKWALKAFDKKDMQIGSIP